MITELFINDQPIDIADKIDFPITYKVSDLKEPQKRKRSTSKTIRLPGTKRNNTFFASAYDLAIKDTDGSGFGFDFDPTLRYPARVLRNGAVIFAGTCNLESVNRKNGINTFNLTLYSAMTDIFQALGDITISELGWSEYDHVLNVTNIQNSWTAALGSSYWYPLIDYGFTDDPLSYKTNELRPFVYFKEIVEKCFEYAGFEIASTFINSLFFRQFTFGYGGGDPVDLSAAEVTARRANYTADGTRSDTLKANWFQITGNKFYYNLPTVIADNDYLTTTLVTDPTAQFDTDTGELIIGSNGNYNLRIQATMDVTWSFLVIPGVTYVAKIIARLEIFKNYALIGSQVFNIEDGIPNTEILNFDLSQDIDGDAGDVIVARFRLSTNESTAIGLPKNDAELTLSWDVNNTVNYDFTATNPALIDGDTVELSRHLPKMKAKDFMTDIITMFNLYIDDPDPDQRVLVEPFRDFYQETDEAEDWSKKLDDGQDMEIKAATTIQGKTYQFMWAEDRDYYKERYFKAYGIDYGDFNYNVPSTFKQGEVKYQLKMAQSVPVQLEGTDIIIPRILKYDEGTGVTSPHKGKPRAFLNLGLQASDDWDLVNSDTGSITTLSSYPQAHHLDDLTTATFDFNFGKPEVVFYAATTYTTNNLFYKYHAQLIRELTSRDSKIINAFFDLRETDFYKGFMRYLVNIDGVIYRKNIIKDFMATARQTTKVELIRLVDAFSKKDFQESLPQLPQLPIDNVPPPITGDFTAKSYVGMYTVDTTAADVTATLDGRTMQKGKEITFKKLEQANNLILSAVGGTIDGRSTLTMKQRFDAVTVKFDGTDFHII